VIEMRLDRVAEVIGGRWTAPAGDLPATGVGIDSRRAEPGDLFVALRGERFDGHDYLEQAAARGAVAGVCSRTVPDLPLPCIEVEDTVAALAALAAHNRDHATATVIAVTGSNGKTTTKGMIGHVLATTLRGQAADKSFNNHIGLPLTLLAAGGDDQYVVAEIGSSAPGEVERLAAIARPDIAVITSVGPAHLEGLGGLGGVVREKTSLLSHVPDGGLAVVNADQPDLRAATRAVLGGGGRRVELVTFGASPEADLRIVDVRGDLSGICFRLDAGPEIRLPLCGTHNAANAAAAFLVCRRMGLDADRIAAALATFQPAEMRLNVIRRGEVTIINDSYNANPASMAAAIEALVGLTGPAIRRRVLVAGDMLELGDQAPLWHERIGRQSGAAGVEVLIAAGDHARRTVAGARAASADIETVVCPDADGAAQEAVGRLRDGDVVLVKGSRGMGMERVVEAITAR